MIIKLLGALIFILSCAGFGLCINKENKIKIAELENLKKCIDVMKNDMCISFKSFYEALGTASEYADNNNRFIFSELLKCNNQESDVSLYDKVDDILKYFKKCNLYNDKDIHIFENINNIIGKSDISCLKDNFELFKQEIDNRVAELNGEIKSKTLFGKIAIYISFIIVVFLF